MKESFIVTLLFLIALVMAIGVRLTFGTTVAKAFIIGMFVGVIISLFGNQIKKW